MQHRDLARAGDPVTDTFSEHRPLLFSIAYRMLGSAADAEDILQDAFLRWQISAAGVESPRRFLATMVSRLCINHLKSARVRREQYVGQWLPEPVFTPSRDDPTESVTAGESISMAFMVLLERLNPLERAVFVLREVFDYDYSGIAEIVGRREAYCRQLLHRAHAHLKRERTRFDAKPEQHATLLQRFLEATLRGDLDGLLAVLSNDVVLFSDGGGKAPAVPLPVFGAEKAGRLMIGATKKFAPEDAVFLLAPLNGKPAIVAYVDGVPRTAILIEARTHGIQRVFIISNPEKFTTIPHL